MGTHTDFYGAIRIRPQIGQPLADRLSAWLASAHIRRDVGALRKLYPTDEELRAHTLFGDGDLGDEGEFYLPDRTSKLDFIFVRGAGPCPLPEGLTDELYQRPPRNCPDLESDLELVHREDGTCSYIGWDGGEYSYCIPDWLYLIAGYLVPRGYKLDGTMFAVEEFGSEYYYINVKDRRVDVEPWWPETTYADDFRGLYLY